MNSVAKALLLAFGISFLAQSSAAPSSCLIPVRLPSPDPGHILGVFPTREEIFVSTTNNLYRLSDSGEIGEPVKTVKVKAVPRVIKVFDTKEGVLVMTGIGPGGSQLYRFASERGLDPLLGEKYRNKFQEVIETSEGVFVRLTDNVYQLKGIKLKSIDKIEQCEFDEAYRTESLIFFPAINGSLCKLADGRLEALYGQAEGLIVEATETSFGVFLHGPGSVYRLNENDHIEQIKGIPDDRLINKLFEVSGRLWVGTTIDLFAYASTGVFVPVAGSDDAETIFSMHEIGGKIYVLAQGGVFRLNENGSLEGFEQNDIGGVRKAGVETSEGIFFISFDYETYRLTNDGRSLAVALPETHGDKQSADAWKQETPMDIVNTRVGPLLATNRAVYRFSETNRWVQVPSEDLERDVNILLPEMDAYIVDVPIIVMAKNGLFRWVESSLDDVSVVFEKQPEDTGRPGYLQILRWKLLNFPCNDVPSAIKQSLMIHGPKTTEQEVTIRRASDAVEFPWYADFRPEHTQKIGEYTLKLTVLEPGNGEALQEEIGFTVHKDLFYLLQVAWKRVSGIVEATDPKLKYTLCALVAASVLTFIILKRKRIRFMVLNMLGDPRTRNQIFISYRRMDAGGHARALYEQLCRRFGPKLIFFDRASIESGNVFPKQLQAAGKGCSVLLVLIAPDWLEAKKADGTRRLEDPDDFVLTEIALALELDKFVIPVLFDETPMPKAGHLPEPLKPLVNFDALVLTGKDYEYGTQINELAQRIAKIPSMPPPKRIRVRRAA